MFAKVLKALIAKQSLTAKAGQRDSDFALIQPIHKLNKGKMTTIKFSHKAQLTASEQRSQHSQFHIFAVDKNNRGFTFYAVQRTV